MECCFIAIQQWNSIILEGADKPDVPGMVALNRSTKWDIPLEDNTLPTIVLNQCTYNNKVGMIAESMERPVPVWHQGSERNLEVNFSLKRVDWIKSKEVLIRNNFFPNFLEAVNRLLKVVDVGGLDDSHHRLQVEGSGGRSLMVSVYSSPGCP